jgi:hypothetical protein
MAERLRLSREQIRALRRIGADPDASGRGAEERADSVVSPVRVSECNDDTYKHPVIETLL